MKEETWIQDGLKLKKCPNGFIVVIAELINNKWHYTNVGCPE